MKRYTVNQLAQLSGVSVRALHHYDRIGLLEPAYVGVDNGYRYYEKEQLLRLQQILFYRELGFTLAEIAAVLDQPDFDRIAALEEHRARLEAEATRYRQLITTIDRTIAEFNGDGSGGDGTMQHADLYKGFEPEKHAEYEEWLVERYGGDMQQRIDVGKGKYANLSDADKEKLMTELAQVEADLAEGCRRKVPADSPSLEPALVRHRAWVSLMWDRPCPPEAYAGLADVYLSHPDFHARYETLEIGFCAYLTTAMKAYAERIA